MPAVSERIALGFCNNVDYEIVWNTEVLNDLANRYRIRADEPDAQVRIHTERDLLISILGFMQTGQGGERFVSGSDILERFASRFDKKVTLGGTSARAAIAMRKLGHRSALHLITQNDHVRRLVPQDSPYVCSNEPDSIFPHLIVQFDAGDRVKAGDIDIGAGRPNRLIYHCNADRLAMRIAPEFADLIHDAEVLLVSGFNAMQSKALLFQRLREVMQLLERLPRDASVYLEDGGYHDPAFRKLIYGSLGSRIDVYSMNEDELQSHLKREIALDDATQVRQALNDLHEVIPAATLVLHTRHWAIAHGKSASRYADALRAGVTMATTRFRYGDDFTRADYNVIASRAPNMDGAEFARWFNASSGDSAVCVPVADVEQAKATTIGLGDAFVGGFLPALLA
jgi:ADP-dependent phosphofructokinase/glucokinase